MAISLSHKVTLLHPWRPSIRFCPTVFLDFVLFHQPIFPVYYSLDCPIFHPCFHLGTIKIFKLFSVHMYVVDKIFLAYFSDRYTWSLWTWRGLQVIFIISFSFCQISSSFISYLSQVVFFTHFIFYSLYSTYFLLYIYLCFTLLFSSLRPPPILMLCLMMMCLYSCFCAFNFNFSPTLFVNTLTMSESYVISFLDWEARRFSLNKMNPFSVKMLMESEIEMFLRTLSCNPFLGNFFL